MRMSEEEFYHYIEENIRYYLPMEYHAAKIRLYKSEKYNMGNRTALYIAKNDRGICPGIHLNSFYSRYQNGESEIRLLNELADLRQELERTEETMEQQNFVQRIVNYDAVKSKLRIAICDAEKNAGFLEEHPHKTVGDFTATYYIKLTDEQTIPISNEILRHYGVSVDRLHQDALEAQKSEYALYGMDFFFILFPEKEWKNLLDDDVVTLPENDVSMYILTTKDKFRGASAILDDEVLQLIGQKMGDDYYVLPSSIHETILVPAFSADGWRLGTGQELETMVAEINAAQVLPEEQLSEKVQYYDREKGRLFNAREYDAALAEDMMKEHTLTDTLEAPDLDIKWKTSMDWKPPVDRGSKGPKR